MEFKQVNRWYMQSEEGYRISKALTECPLPYAAWPPGSKTENPALAFTPTAKEAIQACEEHFNNRSKP